MHGERSKPTQSQHKAREQLEVHVHGCLFCANKCTMSSDSDSDSDISMTIGVPSVPSAACKADADDGSEASSAKIGATGTNDTACAANDANTAKDDTNNRSEEQNKDKSERARQRWAILRAALLGNSNNDANGDDNGKSANANNANDASTQVNRASIHRFEGFQLLDRKLLPLEDAEKCAHIVKDLLNGGKIDDNVEDKDEQEQAQESDQEYEYAEYAIPVPSNTPIRVRTRERWRRRTQIQKGQEANSNTDDTKKKRIDQVMRGLLSHRLHGVDNTGQSCVWDSESTLTYCLLGPADSPLHNCKKDATDDYSTAQLPLGIDNILSLAISAPSENAITNEQNTKKMLRVVELGAGMAGLSGLSLAAFGMIMNQSNKCTTSSSSSSCVDVDIQLTLTDGHPDAVRSNRICASLTTELYRSASSNANVTPNRSHIICQRLLWNDGNDGVEDCRALTNNGQDRYQLCLASDCVHFQEFHAALLATIGRLLGVGGVCLLCQPRRADSLENFMKVVDAVNTCGAADASAVFEMKLYERYNQRLWDLHKKELAKGDDGIYDAGIHYPLLLVLKKVGEYKEDVHTEAAIEHVGERQ